MPTRVLKQIQDNGVKTILKSLFTNSYFRTGALLLLYPVIPVSRKTNVASRRNAN
jgi:hypothetical protein